MKFKNKGLTLIEALIWFVLFATVLFGVFSLYTNSRDSNRTNTVNKELAVLYSKGNEIYDTGNTDNVNGTSGGSASVNTTMINMGAFPNSLKIVDGTVYNQFGGRVFFAERTNGFVVLYTKIPSGTMCINIIKAQQKIGWNFAVIGAINRVTYDDNFSYSQTVNLCKGEGGNAAKTIDLQFASCSNC